eukprot:51855_1
MTSQRSNKCNRLIHGYVRRLQRLLQRPIPTSITELCFDFYFILKPFKYEWTITNPSTIESMKHATNEAMWHSSTISMYGFKWHISVYPCGVTSKSDQCVSFRFRLEAIPANVHSIQLATRFLFVQADVEFVTATVTLSRHKLYTAWQSSRLKTIEIQKYNTFTFTVEPELIAVFDMHGNDMSYQYLDNHNFENFNDFKYLTEYERINAMVTDKLDCIIDKIDLIEQRLSNIENGKYKNKNDNDDFIHSGQENVKQWLEKSVKLPQYYNLFMENGIEHLSIVSLLTIHTIKAIGIDKIGHQLKILNEVDKLKQHKI